MSDIGVVFAAVVFYAMGWLHSSAWRRGTLNKQAALKAKADLQKRKGAF